MSFLWPLLAAPMWHTHLFNRPAGLLALVDDQPGVTRDLREGEARLGICGSP